MEGTKTHRVRLGFDLRRVNIPCSSCLGTKPTMKGSQEIGSQARQRVIEPRGGFHREPLSSRGSHLESEFQVAGTYTRDLPYGHLELLQVFT